MTQNCAYPCYQNKRTPLQPKPPTDLPLTTIFFDMDGVLADILSSWRYIHDHFNTSNQHSVEAYLNGKIDDHEFIRRDISLWHTNGTPTTHQHIKTILDKIPLMPGAHQLFTFLHQHNITPVIISAGLDILANRIAKELNIPHSYANGIHHTKDGHLTGDGILNVQLKYKDKIIQQFMKKNRLKPQHCAAIGNSCFDVPMFSVCGLSIAFNPVDSCVKEAADLIVENKNLTQLIPILTPFLH